MVKNRNNILHDKTRRWITGSLIAITLTLSGIPSLHAQSDKQSASSVVKITATYKNSSGEKVISTATGWAWNKSTQIVTALHAVAGVTDIKIVNTNGKRANAKIIKVVKEADLALLQLDKDIGLTPLQTIAADPQSLSTYYVWGYPHAVHTIQGDAIQFSRSLEARPTLSHIITGTKLKQELKNQGYPLPSANIYRISSTIQPGHSGAPIFTSSGQVIGIADGGLRGGTARINWAMPADQYVKMLLNSNDHPPRTTSVQTNLYSSSVTVTEADNNTSTEETLAQNYEESVVYGEGDVSLVKVWTASYYDVFELLDEDTQDNLLEMTEEDDYGPWLESMEFDIYEDYDSGISFAVPMGTEVSFSDNTFEMQVGNLTYAFAPYTASTINEAKDVIDLTIDQLFSDHPEAVLAEDEDYEEGEEYYERFSFRNVIIDGEERMLMYGGESYGVNGAFVGLESNVYETFTDEDAYHFLHLSICSELLYLPD